MTHLYDRAPETIALGWEWDFWVTGPLLISLLLYTTGLFRIWRRAGIGRGVTIWQATAFAAGWLVLAAALVSPLHEYGEHLFAAHMVEHELLMAVAGPLLALARPLGMFLNALPLAARRKLIGDVHTKTVQAIWKWAMRPLHATLLHGVAIWVWHIPPLLDATLVNQPIHRLQHISFLGTALIFWWAIMRVSRQAYGASALHVFATMVHTGLLGALLTLAPRVMYPLQTADAWRFGLKPLEDQQLAGLLMWVPGGALYLLAGLAFAGLWLNSGLRPAKRRASATIGMDIANTETVFDGHRN